MDSHFHILAKVPDRKKWLEKFEGAGGEVQLLQRLATIYSKAYLKQLRNEIAVFREQGNEVAVQDLLGRFKERSCDISVFVKELKQKFSRWFNKQNGRCGTLWMDRFKRVFVDGPEALATMAAYIDVDPVRDPMDYQWSGYGEACGGSRRAKRGLCKAMSFPRDLWEEKDLPRYRVFLYDEGLEVEEPQGPRWSGKQKKGLSKKEMAKVQMRGGELTKAQRLQKRNATFSTGVVIGGESFVRQKLKEPCLFPGPNLCSD